MTPHAAQAIHGLVLWGFLAALYYAMPALTRPELYFAVTVPAAFRQRAEARSTLRRYHRRIVRSAAVALIAVGAGAWLDQPAWFAVAAVGQTVGAIHGLLAARREIEPFAVAPSSAREAALAPRPGLPGGWVAQLGPFALLAATAVHRALDDAPPGESSGYRALAAAAMMCGVLLVTALGTAYRSPRIRASGPARHAEHRFRNVTLGIVLGAEYLAAGNACGAVLWRPGSAVRIAVALGTLVIAAAAAIVLARLGQGGARRTPAAADAPIGDGAPDARWKWGVLYVNPDDPAVFVEKRFGIGYTINLGNPRAWAWLALIGVAVGVSLVARA